MARFSPSVRFSSPLAALPALTAALLLAGSVGCQRALNYDSPFAVSTYWSSYRLEARLDGVPPQRALAAAEATLRDRGYFIKSSGSVADRGRLVAEPPNVGGRRMTIDATDQGDESTLLRLAADPFGDEILCRITLDGILERLGYPRIENTPPSGSAPAQSPAAPAAPSPDSAPTSPGMTGGTSASPA